MRYYVTNKRP